MSDYRKNDKVALKLDPHDLGTVTEVFDNGSVKVVFNTGTSKTVRPRELTLVRPAENREARVLTDEEVVGVRLAARQGLPTQDIARHLGVSESVVRDIVRGRIRQNAGEPKS